MIAYNKELFHNTLLIEEAGRLERLDFMDKKQLQFVESKLPAYHRHANIFVRACLFLLGVVLYAAFCGFTALMIRDSTNLPVYFLFNALGGILVLELLLIRSMKFYGNGVGEAFLVCIYINLLCFAGFLHRDSDSFGDLFILAAVLGLVGCLRYVDRLSALLACCGLTGFVSYCCLHGGATGKLILPFACMLLAVAICWLSLYLKKTQTKGYYRACIQLCFVFGCTLFYLSGNYFVIRRLSEELPGMQLAPGQDIGLAPFFYAFTFLCPLAFVVAGLRKLRHDLLWLGLLGVAFSIAGFRYYHHVLPTELALIFGGLLVFAIAYLAMRRLKGKTSGLSFEHDRVPAVKELLAAEALWLISNYQQGTASPSHSGAEPGGGGFGGAGSAGKF